MAKRMNEFMFKFLKISRLFTPIFLHHKKKTFLYNLVEFLKLQVHEHMW